MSKPTPHFDDIVVQTVIELSVGSLDHVEKEHLILNHVGVVAFLLQGDFFKFECAYYSIK